MHSTKNIFAKDYGILPNQSTDCTQAFYKMLTDHPENACFILDPGTYHFSSEEALRGDYYISNTDVENPRHLSILLKDMKNITIDGNGSLFLHKGQTIPFTVDHCDTVTLKNITIDWSIPLSAEGLIVDACKEWTDMKIDSDLFPHFIKENWLYFKGENWESPYGSFCQFDHTTKKVAYGTADLFQSSKQEQLEDGTIRFYGPFDPVPTPGNYGVLRHNRRLHPGIFLNQSSNLHLEHITIHNTGGLGILAQFCENLAFDHIRFEANRAAGRKVVSGHDDGLHLSNNRGEITVEHCSFYGLMDDPINVHGTTVKITEIVDTHTLKGIFVHYQAVGFDCWAEKGQTISFIDHLSMASRGTGTVNHFELLSPKEFIITFDTPVPSTFQVGDALENLTNSPSLICRNNYFGSCRARGVLVSTPKKVLIENNVFESAGSAILIAGDANFWYESGACSDVLIRGNHFADCCMTSMYQFCEGIISICPEIPKPELHKPFHRNIKITENTFQSFDYSVLYALSVQGLEFSHNRIIRSYVYEPMDRKHHMINLEYCSNVTLHDNHLIGDVLGQDVHTVGMEDHSILFK